MIDTGEFGQGERLPGERRLAENFKTSRSSIRLALNSLAEQGYLTPRERSGWTVTSPEAREGIKDIFSPITADQRTFHQVLDLRTVLEPQISARAATRRRDSELMLLSQPLELAEAELIKKAPRPAFLQRLDVEFHSRIARLAHNPLLAELVDQTHLLTRETRKVMFYEIEPARTAVAAHRIIYTAIARKDPQAAQEAMRLHLRDVLAAVTAANRLTKNNEEDVMLLRDLGRVSQW